MLWRMATSVQTPSKVPHSLYDTIAQWTFFDLDKDGNFWFSSTHQLSVSCVWRCQLSLLGGIPRTKLLLAPGIHKAAFVKFWKFLLKPKSPLCSGASLVSFSWGRVEEADPQLPITQEVEHFCCLLERWLHFTHIKIVNIFFSSRR